MNNLNIIHLFESVLRIHSYESTVTHLSKSIDNYANYTLFIKLLDKAGRKSKVANSYSDPHLKTQPLRLIAQTVLFDVSKLSREDQNKLITFIAEHYTQAAIDKLKSIFLESVHLINSKRDKAKEIVALMKSHKLDFTDIREHTNK
ncbi:hypothetical protein MED121_01375 [Marinomonas sp. MED121]|uniref:hypothetical protein n=1 Tax=Marinomonas sp. MED121 TaxID=314277 RepID=UPI0000690AF4|nr:hypothetical protein [Marinomonas sp. MED121]EAQ65820.1 hypothetical protein MED121_01375 [Marinomonas sp. MED121]